MPLSRIQDGANCHGGRRSCEDHVLLRLLASLRARTWRLIPGLLCAGLALLAFSALACGRVGLFRRPVVLYTSVPSSLMAEVEAAFEREHPAWDLQVFRAGTGDVMARVHEELAGGRVEADLIWVADFSVGEELKGMGVLLQHRPTEADALLPILADKDDAYFGARLLNMVVAYNTDAMSAPPTGYADLLDPQYRGRLGHASPRNSGAFLYFMGTLLADPAYGEQFFRELAANAPAIQTNSETTERIASGELDVGITIDFTVRELLLNDPDAAIDLVYPEGGFVMVPSPIALFQGARNVEGAKAFESYILSQAGQTMLRDTAGVVPVRLDVTPPGDIQSITQLRVIPADAAWLAAHRDDVLATFARLYGEE